jgi:glycosyltransferase involved in cell wall biosynthesis
MVCDDGITGRVSVVIPTHYRNELLRDAVRSARAQTWEDVETLVVDCTGERHAAPLESELDDVAFLYLPDERDPSVARSVGVAHATGELVAFLDDDDLMAPDRIERQVRVWDDAADTGVVYCGLRLSNGAVVSPSADVRGDVLDTTLTFAGWPCVSSTMLVERDLLRRLAPFPLVHGADDLALLIELARRTEFDFVHAPLVYKRLLDGSLGRSFVAVDGRRQILDEYESLYASRPDEVYAAALANTYETQAAITLIHEGWSLAAIRAVRRHCRHAPTSSVRPYLKLAASVLGHPGWRVASRLGTLLRG